MGCKIMCVGCRKKFPVNIFNTRIVGPQIEVTCPFCGLFVDRNVSKFAEIQIDLEDYADPNTPRGGRIQKAVRMQKLFQAVESIVLETKNEKRK